MILSKQMIRDKIIFKNPVSISELTHSIFQDETISMRYFNEVAAYVAELEMEGTIKYNHMKHCYEADIELN